MKFRPMPKDEIIKSIKTLYDADQYTIVLILTDGEALCGTIKNKLHSFIGEEWIPASELCFSETGALELYFESALELSPDKSISIYVPLKEIAGIAPLPYSQKTIEKHGPIGKLLKHTPIPQLLLKFPIFRPKNSAYKVILRETILKASKLNFDIREHKVAFEFKLNVPPFDFGDIPFTNNCPLYCDWEYLARKRGGLSNIGFGVSLFGFGGSVSAARSPSLWSEFQKKVKKTEVSLKEACGGSEVTLSGYVSFIIHNSGEEESMKMEGATWIGAFIASDRIKSVKQLTKTSWVICYFREDSFMYPRSLWEQIAVPIKIYGEVVPTPFRVGVVEAKCFVKARAAAYLKR
nr:hypothetical protein [Candidatus Freyarchaeota archaeon]